MTKRCHHEYETKVGYPNDLICQKCQSIWTITDYLGYNSVQLMTLPKDVRYKVVERQVKNFNKENPDYYSFGRQANESFVVE